MNDERNDPNEEASDFDLEDAEQITFIAKGKRRGCFASA